MASDTRSALVLFSGGQDSTVCLAHALERYSHVETIGFDNGQRHPAERESRLQVRAQLRQHFPRWAARLGDDHVLDLSLLDQIGGTTPTAAREDEMNAGGLANSFVPGRNLLFFTFAATVADRRGLSVLVGGMCETDFSAYPDCRDNALKSLQVAISLGLDRAMMIDTPLMWLDKAETWAMTEKLGGEPLIELVVEHTHSCFLGDREHRHEWGYGCGMCPSCDLRGKGYPNLARELRPRDADPMTTTQGTVTAIAAIVVFWIVGAYNRLVRLRSDLVARFGAVDERYRQRHALLEGQLELLSTALAAAAPRLDALRAACRQAEAAREHARTRPGAASAVTSLRVAEDILADARARLPVQSVVGTDLPELNARLATSDTALAFARSEFNAAVAAYNEAVRQFPTFLVARLFNFRSAAVF